MLHDVSLDRGFLWVHGMRSRKCCSGLRVEVFILCSVSTLARNRHLMLIILLQEFLQRKQIILYGTMYPATFLLRTGRTESEEGFVFVRQNVQGRKVLKQSSVIF